MGETVVTEMSPKAAALLRAGRDALCPCAVDRDRVAAALRARLGEAVLPLETQASTSLFVRSVWTSLVKDAPRSPTTQRAKQVCGGS